MLLGKPKQWRPNLEDGGPVSHPFQTSNLCWDHKLTTSNFVNTSFAFLLSIQTTII